VEARVVHRLDECEQPWAGSPTVVGVTDNHYERHPGWPDDVPTAARDIDGPLRVRGLPDLISIIPYLLGFHPDESVVIVVCVEGQVALTVRFEIGDCRHPRAVEARLWAIQARFASARFVLAAYSDEPRRAHDALALVEQILEPDSLLDSVVVGSGRYWSRLCTSEECCPPEGVPFDAASGPMAVRAVVAGLQALPRRSDLERRVALPRGGAVGASRRRYDRVESAAGGLEWADRRAGLDELVDRGLDDPASLSDDDLVELAIRLKDPDLRDRVLVRLDRATASGHVRLWERVVRATPREGRVPALCVLALASWVSGDGALQVVCMCQAERIDPGFPLLHLLADINATAAPPSIWDRMLVDIAMDMAGGQFGG